MTRREFLARGGRATAGLAGLSLAAQLTPGRVQAASEVHLTVWWWGEQEAPGLQQWMRETVHRYRAAHPGVEIATVLQATESLYPSFASAGQARQGPDIQYMWGGISTMQFVWRGYVHPISDLLSEDDLEPVFPGSLRETAFQGKVYGLPWYALPFLLVYSKPAFARAGLDPDHPPRTWIPIIRLAPGMRSCRQQIACGLPVLCRGGMV
jgi:multiple sugar transport system substrate-binding protein